MIERAHLAERSEPVPRHVAIVMDGAPGARKLQDAPGGERAAARALRETARAAAQYGVEILTVHVRSEAMVEAFVRYEIEALRLADVGIRAIGPLAALPEATRTALEQATRATANCRGLQLNLALNYGARAELCAAIKALALDVANGRLTASAIDDDLLVSYLYTPSLPDPDLVIGTGSELRISDFLLYQCAYSELWSTTTPWQDFQGRELAVALHAYASRQRRFGS